MLGLSVFCNLSLGSSVTKIPSPKGGDFASTNNNNNNSIKNKDNTGRGVGGGKGDMSHYFNGY